MLCCSLPPPCCLPPLMRCHHRRRAAAPWHLQGKTTTREKEKNNTGKIFQDKKPGIKKVGWAGQPEFSYSKTFIK
jgi:hypothetical protein